MCQGQGGFKEYANWFFLKDEDWARLYVAADELSKSPIYIDDTPALEPLELRARCRRLKSEKGLGLVIIDYLQLMHVPQKKGTQGNRKFHIYPEI